MRYDASPHHTTPSHPLHSPAESDGSNVLRATQDRRRYGRQQSSGHGRRVRALCERKRGAKKKGGDVENG
jgi:hypothetical protein